ncbi:dCTP deaminase [uncultured Lamprocystis sp.]|uniref:dCTP deaminase n=1 Tax=uncultured Lamprocystis sp. TaxID=543132 RepID=UPI00343C8DBC
MLLRSSTIAHLIDDCENNESDPLVITPKPDTRRIHGDSSASVDLRLGTWFRTERASRHPLLDVYDRDRLAPTEHSITQAHYIPFGSQFILHPHSFVLAVTLEWIRLPFYLAGMVTGKSSWGRRGLIIETAPGVHPGYSGCLTLEVTNVGDVPIAIKPGTKICQIFLYQLDGTVNAAEGSRFVGQRQPQLGAISSDEFAEKLFQSRT